MQDVHAPVVTCPQDVSRSTNSGSNVATVTYPAATAVDNTDDKVETATCTPSSGSNFALGVTTVTCTATDSSDNTGKQPCLYLFRLALPHTVTFVTFFSSPRFAFPLFLVPTLLSPSFLSSLCLPEIPTTTITMQALAVSRSQLLIPKSPRCCASPT